MASRATESRATGVSGYGSRTIPNHPRFRRARGLIRHWGLKGSNGKASAAMTGYRADTAWRIAESVRRPPPALPIRPQPVRRGAPKRRPQPEKRCDENHWYGLPAALLAYDRQRSLGLAWRSASTLFTTWRILWACLAGSWKPGDRPRAKYAQCSTRFRISQGRDSTLIIDNQGCPCDLQVHIADADKAADIAPTKTGCFFLTFSLTSSTMAPIPILTRARGGRMLWAAYFNHFTEST